MKTLIEFENALLSGESVYFANGKGLVVDFYPCLRSSVCSLVSVCVEFGVILDDGSQHTSSSVVTAFEAYQTYEALSKMS